MDEVRFIKAIRYDRKCPFCGSWVSVPRAGMKFTETTVVRCICGNTVRFTDDYGLVEPEVSFVYEKENFNG